MPQGNLVQYLTTLVVEKVFLIFNGNFACSSLCLLHLSLVASPFISEKKVAISSLYRCS